MTLLRVVGYSLALVLLASDVSQACSAYRAEALGRFPPILREASGLVRGAGFWWSHNDSGGASVLYAVDDAGKLLSVVGVARAANVDWEELAAGPCPKSTGRGSSRCLYIADTGNNNLTRQTLTVYVVREPNLRDKTVSPIATYAIRYPDQPADTEAMIFDPEEQQLLLFTKEYKGRSRIYTRSLSAREAPTRLMGRLNLSGRDIYDRLLTGAALSPDGRVFLLRSYRTVFRWQRKPGESWNKLFARKPQTIPLVKDEPQGEAVAFGRTGEDFYTLSEDELLLRRYTCGPG